MIAAVGLTSRCPLANRLDDLLVHRAALGFRSRLREIVAEYDWSSIAPGLEVTLSVGLCPRAGETSFEAVLADADRKLYEAKAGGRNMVCA